MSFKALLIGAALAVAALGSVRAEEPAAAAAATAYPPRVVMTWVPPYDRPTSWARLRAIYSGYGPANALTHLGLQFWKPSAAGSVVRVNRYGTITDAVVKSYVDWAHARDIKVMLTIFNGDPTWDWPTAKSAFANNKARFIANLVGEMQRMNLDGIDVDLEASAYDPTPDDKATFIDFMTDLSKAVKARKKLLQVDTFPWIYNATNQTWWPDLFPLVDILASMGYDDLGKGAPDWRDYAAQRREARYSKYMSKLIIGVPSYLNEWQGSDAVSQVKWFVPANIRTGVGIWDARDTADAWRQPAIWIWLRKIRDQNPR